jgi:hypothetical protein
MLNQTELLINLINHRWLCAQVKKTFTGKLSDLWCNILLYMWRESQDEKWHLLVSSPPHEIFRSKYSICCPISLIFNLYNKSVANVRTTFVWIRIRIQPYITLVQLFILRKVCLFVNWQKKYRGPDRTSLTVQYIQEWNVTTGI